MVLTNDDPGGDDIMGPLSPTDGSVSTDTDLPAEIDELSMWIGQVADVEPGYISQAEKTMQMREACDKIRELYSDGRPIFQRAAIQDLVDQIDRTNAMVSKGESVEGERFVLRGIDGSTIKLMMETGEARQIDGGKEIIKTNPFLNYRCYQHLTAGDHMHVFWDPQLAYFPLRIIYNTRLQNTYTKDIVPHRKTHSVEDTRNDLESFLTSWETSERCLEIKSALQIAVLPGPITKIVAFACSTISDERRRQGNSMFQHALLLTVKQILEGRQKHTSVREIQCFAQDPVYSDVDKVVLGGHGITVLEDPRGFLEVDDQTVVLAFAPDICVRQIITDLARPAVLIWNTVRSEEESFRFWSRRFWDDWRFSTLHELEGSLCDPESPRLRDMTRDEYTQLMELDEEAFGSDASIYIRNR